MWNKRFRSSTFLYAWLMTAGACWSGAATPDAESPSTRPPAGPFSKTTIRYKDRAVAELECDLKSAATKWESASPEAGPGKARSPEGLLWTCSRTPIAEGVFELAFEVSNKGRKPVEIDIAVIRLVGDKEQFGATEQERNNNITAARNWLTYTPRGDFRLSPYYGLFFLHGRDFVLGLSLLENAQLPGHFKVFRENLLDFTLGFKAMYHHPPTTRHPYGWGPWVLQPKQLAPGEKLTWHVRVAVWPRDEKQYHTGRALRGLGRFVPTKGQMADLGWTFPKPDPNTRLRGHVMHVDPAVQRKWKDFPELAIRSGTACVVLMSPLADISHGLYYDGQYGKVPPLWPGIIEKCHRYGVKVVPWYSPCGALVGSAESGRPVDKRDPIVQEHPDWFLDGSYYWGGRYVTANPFSGWFDWLVNKVDQDLTRLPTLDGVACDEPFACLDMWDEKTGKTGFTRQVELMRAIRDVVKRHGREKLVIANEGLTPPQANDLFDAHMMEGSPLDWYKNVSGGRFMATRPGGKYFTWEGIYNYYRENFFYSTIWIGWSHLAWYVATPGRTRAENADLLLAATMGEDVYRWQPDVDLIQMEISGDDGVWWVLLNDGKPRKLTLTPGRKLSGGRYRRFVWVDGPKIHRRVVEKPHEITVDQAFSISVGEVPQRGIVTVAWIPQSQWERTQKVLSETEQLLAKTAGKSKDLRVRLDGAKFVARTGQLTRARKLASKIIEALRTEKETR